MFVARWRDCVFDPLVTLAARLFCMHSEDLVVVFYVFTELLHTPTPPAHSHAQLERNKTKYGDFELVVAECGML